MTDWFRSWHGAPTDPKWLGIAKRAGVAPGIAVAVAWALMDRASQAEDRGSIVGYDADGLGYFFGCEPEQVDAIVQAMADKGMLIDGRFTAWERRQPKREDMSTERVREHRKRNVTRPKRDETQCNAPETDTDTELETEGNSLRSFPARARRDQPTISSDWKPKDPTADPAEVKRFIAYNRAKGATMADWDAAWELWLARRENGATSLKAQGPPLPPQTWVGHRDPRWPSLSERAKAERGRPLAAIQSKHQAEPGNYVPNDWLAH